MTTEKADLIFASLPYRILHTFQIPAYEAMAERDKDFYERLETSGFDHDWGDDGSGLFMKYLRRGSGYYIDVGAADLVANGDVKLVKGQIDHLTEDAVVLADGTELPADVVVFATGYGSMNGWVADLIDQETADRLGKVLGPGLGHHQGPRTVGGRAAQHVEADPGASTSGCTAATCTSRATTRSTSRCSSRRASRGSRPRSTACRRCTTRRDRPVGVGGGARGSAGREDLAGADPVGAHAAEDDERQDRGDDRAARGTPEDGVLLGDARHAQQVGELLAPALAVADLLHGGTAFCSA